MLLCIFKHFYKEISMTFARFVLSSFVAICLSLFVSCGYVDPKIKDQKNDKINSRPSKIEQNLREIKKLRYQDKISADEYKRRKQKLLDKL